VDRQAGAQQAKKATAAPTRRTRWLPTSASLKGNPEDLLVKSPFAIDQQQPEAPLSTSGITEVKFCVRV